MTRFARIALVLLALAASGASRPAAAADSLDNCDGMIASLPAVIASPGTWCINQHFGVIMELGTAVTISADNVVVDCHGHTIDNDTASSATTANAIAATDRRNVVVRGCRLDGFFRGIYLQGTGGGGNLVEDNVAMNSRSIGLYVDGDGSIVRRNRVFNTGGSTLDPAATGIRTQGGVDVLDNAVNNVTAQPGGNAFGISSLDSPGGTISGNRVRGLVHGVSTIAAAIHALNHGRLSLRGNDLVGTAGGFDAYGLYCDSNTGRARDNVISGWNTAIDTCSNASGNVVRP